MGTLLIKIITLTVLTVFRLEAQVKIPNSDFNQFKTIQSKNNRYHLPEEWKEHKKNDSWRRDDGRGFAYKYNLPDANGNALALHREYFAETNTILTSFLITENKENLRLVGRYKFSGSDIDTTKDTLRVTVFSTERPMSNTLDIFPENISILDITNPEAQFEWFHLDINEIQKNKYLTIVIQLISGSDDSYYWGQSNTVLDDLKIVTIQNLPQEK